ncbi:MAG: PAS domain-containing sensor histidine kinase [Vicinamibacterales bacterium]
MVIDSLVARFLDDVPLVAAGSDERGYICAFNSAAEQLTGFSRDEVLGQPFIATLVPEAHRADVLARFRAANAAALASPHDNPWQLKSGEERLLEWRCFTVPTGRGATILGLGIDVTRLRAEQAWGAALARQAVETNREKDELIVTLSHELRQPLQVAALGIELAGQSRDEKTRGQALGRAERQIRVLSRLTDDLLDATQVVRGQIRLDRTEIDLRPVVEEVVQETRELSGRHQFTHGYPPTPVIVRGDRRRLRQVLVNVLTNAVKYTPADGRIDVRLETADADAVLRVSDTGDGLPPDALERIFDLFTRATVSGSGGVGIGLAVVRSLVHAHGGTVTAHSDGHGLGSTFVITLPLREGSD